MKVKHIAIPLDQLQLFKEEEKYQNYLVETLIYSTKVTVHYNQSKMKSLMVITKNYLWLEEESSKKKRTSTSLTALKDIVKADEHPELVLITDQNHDNIRISVISEQRCLNIISALAFYFTYLDKNKRPIRIYTIKQNSLLYFERTVKQKKNGPKLSLERYNSTLIKYEQPTDSPDLFGKVLIQKMNLVKQLYIEGSHLMHLAVVNQQNTYICHTLDKDTSLSQKIKNHKNIEFVQKLQYARLLEYKMQLLFQYLPSLKNRTIKITRFFEEVFRLYDMMRQQTKGVGFLSYTMLLRINPQSSQLVLREFRYRQLVVQWQFSAFTYIKILKQKSQQDFYINKMYNIGLLMYEHLFGRVPFAHQDLQMTLYLKNNVESVKFPELRSMKSSKKLEQFIESCILGKFGSKEQLCNHPWLAINKIQI